MNERIRELEKQCWDNQTNHLNVEKFALLIVRECAEFSRQHNLQKADRSYMIHHAIKEHFGVGE